MIRNYKYTVLSLLFAVLFIFGSMTAMSCILRIRETKLLTEMGRAEVESPVREWIGWGADGDHAASGAADGESVLTAQQAEEAVKSWNNRSRITLHDPVAGQISMEEAIENGESWLVEMGISEEMGAALFSVSAKLGVGGQNGDAGERLEAYFSFWTVTYTNQSMSARLYLNAVTGKVWGAEITLNEKRPVKLHDDSLKLFVELAGLQAADDSAVVNSGATGAEIAIKESRLIAQERSYSMSVGLENSYDHTIYQLLVKQK